MDVDSSKSKHDSQVKTKTGEFIKVRVGTYQSPQQTLTTMPQMSPVMSLYENK